MNIGRYVSFLPALLIIVSTAAAGRERDPQTAIVRIPGSIKKSPIEFFSGLAPLTASLVAKMPEGKENEPSQSRSGVIIAVPGGKTQNSTGQWYILVNPERITSVGTPIPLEAEIILVRKSGTPQAQVGQIVPDSVAAWKRLKAWTDLKKGISSKTIILIDKSAEEVNQSVLKVLEAGALEQIDKQGLLKKYEAFSQHLGEAFDDTNNFDVMRQLSTAILGVRAERLAWSQVFTKKLSVLNPKYSENLNTRPDGSPPTPDAAASPKASEAIGQTGVGNIYEKYEQLQALQPTLQFKSIYERARASIAICEDDVCFASGTIIGKNLVLTCAHAVARPGRGGTPAARNPRKLHIKVGYEFPKDPNTPEELIPAKIVYEGQVPADGNDALDFVLLKADIAGYEKRSFENAQDASIGIRQSSRTPEEKMAALRDVAFWPIQPLPLGSFDVSETYEFNIAGHPEGRAKLICNHGKVLFPPAMEETNRDDLRRSLTGAALTPDERDKLELRFDNMYILQKRGNGKPWYRYTYGNNSPGIGVICSTVKGNSGGAAIADSDPPCVVGILVEGQPGRSVPWPPGMERHETLLPTTAIIKELEAFHQEKTGDTVGGTFPEPWYKHYQVVIMDQSTDGALSPRQ